MDETEQCIVFQPVERELFAVRTFCARDDPSAKSVEEHEGHADIAEHPWQRDRLIRETIGWMEIDLSRHRRRDAVVASR